MKLISLSTMQPVKIPQCVVGQVVKYTGDMANHSGFGAVVNVRDDPYHRYDVALEDGRQFLASMLDSSRWQLLDETLAPGMLEMLRAGVEAKKASDEAARSAAAEQFKLDIEKVKAAYPYLRAGQSHTNAARNIRIELKRAYPSIKFSVRSESYSGGNSINVSWTDGPTAEQVEAIAKKYSGGSFDGMTDSYNSRTSPFTEVFGDSKYVFCRREYSDKMLACVMGRVCRHLGGIDTLPTVDDYRMGRLWTVKQSGGCDIQREINAALHKHTYCI